MEISGGCLPCGGEQNPMAFGPEAIRKAPLRLQTTGHVILVAPNTAEAGFLPPALPCEQAEAGATSDPAGYLLRRRIARAIALAETAERRGAPARMFSRQTLQILKNAEGGPRFGGAETGLHLSFASRMGINLVGVARQPIGVDLEPMAGLTAIPRNILRPDEIAAIESWPEDQRIPRFLTLWTVKEAIVKAMGTGLSTPPEAIRIADDQSVALRDEDGDWRSIEARIQLFCGANAISNAPIGFPHLTIALALLSRAPQ